MDTDNFGPRVSPASRAVVPGELWAWDNANAGMHLVQIIGIPVENTFPSIFPRKYMARRFFYHPLGSC